jgi:hypothetical protein
MTVLVHWPLLLQALTFPSSHMSDGPKIIPDAPAPDGSMIVRQVVPFRARTAE